MKNFFSFRTVSEAEAEKKNVEAVAWKIEKAEKEAKLYTGYRTK